MNLLELAFFGEYVHFGDYVSWVQEFHWAKNCCNIGWMCRDGNGNPLQYSCMENPMGGGAWYAAVQGMAKSWTCLSDFPFTFHFHALEKEMATDSSVLAWRVPGTGEPGGLPSGVTQSWTRLKRLSSSRMDMSMSSFSRYCKFSDTVVPSYISVSNI